MSKNEEKISEVSPTFRHETVMDFIKKLVEQIIKVFPKSDEPEP